MAEPKNESTPRAITEFLKRQRSFSYQEIYEAALAFCSDARHAEQVVRAFFRKYPQLYPGDAGDLLETHH